MSQFIVMRRALALSALLFTMFIANAAYGQASLSLVMSTSPTTETDALGRITYTAVITNNGLTDATNVVMTFSEIYADLPIDSSPSSCVFTLPGPLLTTCNLGTLSPGSSITATSVIYPTSVGNLFVDGVATESGGSTATFETGSTLTGVGIADTAVALAATPNPAKVNNNLTYALTAYNIGDDDARDVFVSLQLPPKSTFVSASKACTRAGNLVTCQVGQMGVGSSKVFNIVVKPTASGWLFATAGLRESVADPSTLNNSAGSRIWVNP